MLALTMALLSGLMFTTQTKAYALDPGTVRTLLPAGITGAGILAGGSGGAGAVGTVATFGGGAGAAAAGTAVAVAPVAIAAAAVLIGGAALYLGWKWANGTDSAGTALDPAPVAGVGTTVSWDHTGYDATGDYLSFGSVTYQSGIRYAFESRPLPGYPAGIVIIGTECPEYTTINRNIGGGAQTGTFDLDIPAGCDGIVSMYRKGQGNLIQPPAYSRFRPVATPGTAAGPSGSTQVTTRPTSQCSNGASVVGAAIVYTGATPPGSLPPILAPACPAGTTRTGLTTPSTYPDGTTAPSPLAPWTAPTVPSGYPECQGVNVEGCVLTLTQTAPSSAVETCNGTGVCTGWATDASSELVTTRTDVGTQLQNLPDGTTRRVVPRTRPDGKTMRCAWGPYVLPANECQTVPTEVAPAPKPPQDASNCNLADFSLNPVSWVVVPLKCLFIPSPGSLDGAATSVKSAWAGSAIGVIAGGVTGLLAPFATLASPSGDCGGPVVSFTMPLYGELTARPFSTCNRLAGMVLGVVQPIESVLVYCAAIFGGARILTRTIGADSV